MSDWNIFTERSARRRSITSEIDPTEYAESEDGFREYLRDLSDDLFPFPGYHDYQDEILYEVLEAYLLDDYLNVVVEGPTGIGKSAINVTVPHALGEVADQQEGIEDHFGVSLRHLNDGSAFYTTPQKSLRDQLAQDEDLEGYVAMLKSRRDYVCGATGDNCQECSIKINSDLSCRDEPGCTYWQNKESAMQHHIAAITFAMLIVDNYVPPEDEQGGRLSFMDRDIVIIDEGHNSEGQSASLFAGFTLSPWSLPQDIYGDAGEQVSWDDEYFEDVEEVVTQIAVRAQEFISEHEEDPDREGQVEQAENVLRKIQYAIRTHSEGRGWVVNINEVGKQGERGTTKGIEVKPIRVHDFLSEFVWSRGRRSLITSATIPFRGNVGQWAERIGIDENVKLISKPTPFPEEHRLIHLNTMVGPMSASKEDDNWPAAMEQIREIASHHEGEKGLIHAVSYSRAEKVQDWLGSGNIMVEEKNKDTAAVIDVWQNSNKDILVSPTMTEGVDLHGDRCRWQVLLKVPYAYMGDSRVSYLLNEENEWDWYMEEAAIDIIQSVGRAVRGPDPEEAASFYVVDEKFDSVMYRTNPPDYFVEAVRDEAPDHWNDPSAAPWR